MEFKFTAEEEAFRGDVRKFIDGILPPDWDVGEVDGYGSPESIARTKAIVKELASSGWLTMAWPKEYGGMNAPFMKQTIFQEEAAYSSLPTDAGVGAVSWVAPVLIATGTKEQKAEHLPPISKGERFWCTLYSEPGAGSDLASLQTSADRDGDEYIVNGQKIWTSGGHLADWGWLAARTDPAAPKHKGISMFLLDMKTPGVTVRPIINIAGVHHFNEVFFDNVRIPRRNLVGTEHQGWYTLAMALDFERSGVARPASARKTLETFIEYANHTKRNGQKPARNPLIANRLAEMYIEIRVSRWLAYRVAWMQSEGLSPNMEASIIKLIGSEIGRRMYYLGMDLLGLYGPIEEGSQRAKLHGRVAHGYLSSVSSTIAAGTSEVQRNIIATRGLGLPRG